MEKKEKDQQMLLPRIRFPEFQKSREWEKKRLGQYLESHSERVDSSTNLQVFSSTREGLQLQAEYYGGKNRDNKGEYGLVPVGYFVYRHMSDDGVFKFNINSTGEPIAVSKEYPVFSTKNLSPHFLLQLLDWSHDFKKFCLAQKKGGTRTRLYLATLGQWRPALPRLPEQQKIADCLASLDDLIVAHSAKLYALQNQKKGILQKLFPTEGETAPVLRFPEFHKANPWSKRSISSTLMRVSTPVQVETENEYKEIGVRSHGKGVFHKAPVTGEAIGSKRVFKVIENSLVLNIVFAWEQAVATTSESEAGMIASHRFPMYVSKQDACDVRFVKLLFLTPTGKHLLGVASPGGAGRNRTLGQKEFEKLRIPLPEKEEQTKIADSILGLETLITAQIDQIAALKEHKKGLMQQLFPNPELHAT